MRSSASIPAFNQTSSRSQDTSAMPTGEHAACLFAAIAIACSAPALFVASDKLLQQL
jgi:hypothetical protein